MLAAVLAPIWTAVPALWVLRAPSYPPLPLPLPAASWWVGAVFGRGAWGAQSELS